MATAKAASKSTTKKAPSRSSAKASPTGESKSAAKAPASAKAPATPKPAARKPAARKAAAAKSAAPARAGSRAGRKSARAAARPVDAIKLLKDDHRQVKDWFAQYEKLEGDAEKKGLAERICKALTVHTQIEEEIYYPAVRGAIDDDDMLDEAEVEHASAKQLIAEIKAMGPGDRLYDAKVKVLGEYVDHHVEEEESEMFPESRDTDLDLKALGEQMAQRKAELMARADL